MAFFSVYFSTYCCTFTLFYFLNLPSKCLSTMCGDIHKSENEMKQLRKAARLCLLRVMHKNDSKNGNWGKQRGLTAEEDGHRGQTNLYYSLLRNMETIFSVWDCIWKRNLLWGFHVIKKDTESCDFAKPNEKMKLLWGKDANKNLVSKRPLWCDVFDFTVIHESTVLLTGTVQKAVPANNFFVISYLFPQFIPILNNLSNQHDRFWWGFWNPSYIFPLTQLLFVIQTNNALHRQFTIK